VNLRAGQLTLSFEALAPLVRDRTRLAQLVLWAGLLFPLVVDTVRTRDQVLTGDFTPLELARGIVPVVLFCAGVALARPRLRPVTRTELAGGLFLAVATASTLWSINHRSTLLKAGSLAIAYLTIMALARLDERTGQRTLDAMALVVYLIVASALVQLAVAPGAVMISIDGPGTVPRLQGQLPAIAADLLGFYATAGILFAAKRVGPAWTQDRLVRIAIVAICLLVLVLTRARTAAGLLALGLLLLYGRAILQRLAALSERDRRWLFIAAGAAVAVLAIGAGVEHRRVLSLLSRGQSVRWLLSLQGRTVTWGDALRVWIHRPVLGYGYYSGHRFAIPVRPGFENLQNLDSMWVETLVDVGVVGVAAMALLVASAARDLLKPIAADPQLAIRRVLFALAVLASFVNPSLQDVSYTMLLLGVVCWGAPRLQLRG
jgi:O-antigen ligase